MTARRLEEVWRILATSHLQGFLVTFLPNVRYLTGFTGSNAVVFVRQDEVVLITDSRYRNQASTEVKGVRTIIAPGSQPDVLVKSHLAKKGERIGFEAGSLTFSSHKKLKILLKGIKLVPTASIIEQIRVQKDENEITAIRRAAQITDRVFKKILTILKPGVRELEVAAEISYWHRIFGAESDAFDPIVASGVRGAYPHGRATAKKLRIGEMITIDMGCKVEGYHSDLTRTVCLGKARRELKSMYNIVLEAQQKALDAAAPAIPVSVLDGIGRNHIRRNGYGKFFTHSLGHGIGLEIHERPLVSAKSTDTLKENSVITIEPGIYLPEVGGVRIEDDVVIRREGNEVLTKAPKELIVL